MASKQSRLGNEFPVRVRDAVKKRAGNRCSNPHCRKPTSGPANRPEKAIEIGVAAHITAAARKGPRGATNLSSSKRAGIANAIWLCWDCSVLIDRDTTRYTKRLLLEWKARAERAARAEMKAGSDFRAIAPSEIRSSLTNAEKLAVKVLRREFACPVKTGVSVPVIQGGWLNFFGAVVRSEALIAIEVYELSSSRHIPYFQIEHLAERGRSLSFERFNKFVLYVLVVSSAPPDDDQAAFARLQQIAEDAGFEMNVRIYRLNDLRARYER